VWTTTIHETEGGSEEGHQQEAGAVAGGGIAKEAEPLRKEVCVFFSSNYLTLLNIFL